LGSAAFTLQDTQISKAWSIIQSNAVVWLGIMDELPPLEPQEREIPRWVQVPSVIALGLFTLFCGIASLSLLLAPNKKSLVFCVAIGLVLLFLCFWVLEKCFRLLTGRKNRGGLMAPKTLRIVSFFFLVFPVAGLFTGYYGTMGIIAIFQAICYFFAFFGLREFARNRQAKETEGEHNMPTCHDRPADESKERSSVVSRIRFDNGMWQGPPHPRAPRSPRHRGEDGFYCPRPFGGEGGAHPA